MSPKTRIQKLEGTHARPNCCMKTLFQSSSLQVLNAVLVSTLNSPVDFSRLTTKALIVLGLLTILCGCGTSLPPAYTGSDAAARRLRFVGIWSGLEHLGTGSEQTSFGILYHLSPDGTGYEKIKLFGRSGPVNDHWGGEYKLDVNRDLVWELTGPNSISIKPTSLERSNGPKYVLQFSKGPWVYSLDSDGQLHDQSGVTFTKATDGNETAALTQIASAASTQHAQQMANAVADSDGDGSVRSGLAGFAQALAIGASAFGTAVQTNNPAAALAAGVNAAVGNEPTPAPSPHVPTPTQNDGPRTFMPGRTSSSGTGRLGAPVGTTGAGHASDDGCAKCANNPTFLTWKQRCQNNNGGANQSPCYCAEAALQRCMIEQGGCGSSVADLRSAMNQNLQSARELGTTCFSN